MYNRIYTTRTLDITTKWQHVKLNVGRILYVIMQKQDAEIHLYGGKIYTTRITCGELKEQLGEDFLEIRRGCLVSAITIQNITETVNLINGEALKYTIRRKKKLSTLFVKNSRPSLIVLLRTIRPRLMKHIASIIAAMKMHHSPLQTSK